ncbi:MAG: family 16 glycosylhydrolase [Flavobacteriales bacterium]|nr:family 16 glycosylhydrolase [Flavobacteriales bacterium]
MRISKLYPYYVWALVLGFLTACGETTPSDKGDQTARDLKSGWVSAVSFAGKSSNATVSKDSSFVNLNGSDEWLDLDIEITEAGRYRLEASLRPNSSDAVVWVEDHRDNPDDRTYNISTDIALDSGANTGFEKISREGVPLNAGLHKMRIHTRGNVDVKSIGFELVKQHRETPEVKTQNMDGDEWELVWSDEFEEGETPDTTKWTYDFGNWGWGNQELQYYTVNRSKNARIENGNLIIEAHKDDMNQPWTSARLTTREKVSFVYGKIEFKAKVPPEKGNWSAGWTLGDSYVDELSWPYCGEIDILESVGYEMDNETGNGIAHASAHCAAYYFKLGNQPTGTTPVENMHEAFHTYGIVWTPDSIAAYVDDKFYFTYGETGSEASWPFSDPQNIILNLTMGGGWGGAEGMDSTVTSQRMIVDYVRVYQKVKLN